MDSSHDPRHAAERTRSSYVEPGARWLRCDLHVHTPFDPEKRFGENIQDAIKALQKSDATRLAKIAERFVEACLAADGGHGIDLVALTDHNSIEGYKRLRPQFQSIADRAKDEGRRMPVILPGVEFSVGGERPLHFLVIFAASTCPEEIASLIRHVFGSRRTFDPKVGTPLATGESAGNFLRRLYEYAKPATDERNLSFVLLPAHADGHRGVAKETGAHPYGVSTSLLDELKGHLRQWNVARTEWNGFETAQPFERLPEAFRDLLCRWWVARRAKDWDALSRSERQRVREQTHWPLVECSDPQKYEAIGSRFTWLKMEVPDVEGIRLALLDPESRLRRMADGPPARKFARIERLRVADTDFFQDVEVPFNPCLTTLIGGRGAGKSTVIEYLRYVLDRARGNDLRDAETSDVLTAKEERDFGRTRGTLLPKHELTADIVVAERRYRVRRNVDGLEVTRDGDQPEAQAVPLEVRSLLAPRILSQRQIARIARDPVRQRKELDALMDSTGLREIDERRRSLVESLTRFQGIRRRLLNERDRLPSLQTELRTVFDQIQLLEEGDRRETLLRFTAFEQERRWLEDLESHLGAIASRLSDEVEAVGKDDFGPGAPPVSTPTALWLRSVASRLGTAHQTVATSLQEQVDALRALASDIREEKTPKWEADYQTARTAYEDLRDEMEERSVDFAQHEKLLQRRAQLEREIGNLERSGHELDENERRLRATRLQLVETHETRLAARRKQAKSLEEMNADVRLEVHSFRDRDDFESRREDWFGGSGLYKGDWEDLCDYVFAQNAEVPDRIAALTEAIRVDLEDTASAGRALDPADSEVTELLGQPLTRNFFNALARPERIRLDEMERFLPEDLVEARVRTAEGPFKTIETGSVGEKSTAILSLLLSAGDQPIIIDQPEDDLDNQYVYNVVVNLLRHRKFSRQVIIATHNANIPVNGDAEAIVALGAEKRSVEALAAEEPGVRGVVLDAGSIDRPEVKELVSRIMEGSAEAFRLRSERYGY